MSEFGNFLQAQVVTQNTTGGELAARMGIDRAHFSQFINDRRRSCNIETLMKMAHGISPDTAVQAGLLQAYFRDQCVEAFKSWVSVDPSRPASDKEESDLGAKDAVAELAALLRQLRLPNDLVRSFADIARYAPGKQKFRLVIEDLGKFAREEQIEEQKKPLKKR